MSLDISQIRLSDITDTEGAAKRLTDRFGRTIGVERVRQFVKTDRLHPLMFKDGVLVERQHSEDTRGKDLFFLLIDLDALPEPVAGYPKGKPRK